VLSEEEFHELRRALYRWSERVPDVPVLGFLDSDSLMTPREVFEHFDRRTSEGRGIRTILEHGVRREGLPMVVERFSLGRNEERAR
jgi:hypothetical protein